MTTRARSLARLVAPALTACLLATFGAAAHAEPAPVPPPGSVSVSVNCAAGQSLATALGRLADRSRPIAITVTGADLNTFE